MKIIFGINNFDNAGAENFMLRLAKYFAQNKKHQVFLFSLYKISEEHIIRVKNIFGQTLNDIVIISKYKPTKFEDYILWKLNRVYKTFGIDNFYTDYIETKTKRKILKIKPDIINTHLFETDLYFSENFKLNHVISMHGPYEFYLHKSTNESPLSTDLNYEFIKTANSVLNSSKNIIYCADKNLEIFKHINNSCRLKKIYYGFEQENVLNKKHKKNISIGMFARGIKSKGWEYLLDAFLALKAKYVDVELYLAYTETEYMNMLKQRYSSKDINFLGQLDDISKIINEINLTVFPTYYSGESLPNTIIESLKNEIPVISSEIAEIPNMINMNGIMAGQIIKIKENDQNNVVHQIIEAVSLYCDNKDLFAEHTRNTRTVSEQFDMRCCYLSYEAFFQSTIKSSVN